MDFILVAQLLLFIGFAFIGSQFVKVIMKRYPIILFSDYHYWLLMFGFCSFVSLAFCITTGELYQLRYTVKDAIIASLFAYTRRV
ncbi:hypothetical protein [Halotia branconii]|uniref:Uncharacterized protein n=1 Tax=Halotia branconii CENA392 TaxID=1539056 RepID=A0AAJ6PCJ4_9CYAN|nr:hypothetical protein [Halotia branconii]WGV29039.1 hypothetical protein QI031_31260 [Halotia branconii CENA392]